jgi:predicted aspartyl protease
MGFVHVNVGLSNPSEPDRTEEIRVLVDTGATLSVFPANLLEGLGIQRIGQRRFRGFGGVVAREVGAVTIHYGGEVAGTTAVFGADDDPVVMGVTALETLGFNVDPANGELHRVDLLI